MPNRCGVFKRYLKNIWEISKKYLGKFLKSSRNVLEIMSFQTRPKRITLIGAFFSAFVLATLTPGIWPAPLAEAQAQSGGAIQMRASRVEANSNTGVVTATGNVRIDYPSRQIYATSAQAQYYSNEQRIVLSGNVNVDQAGNTLRAETVTYLIAEGRFVATPGSQAGENAQVEAVYILPEAPNPEPRVDPQPATPAPLSIPAPPAELPAELGSVNR